jgi:hypothetical protein
MKTRILERGTDAIAALPHDGIWQADNGELWKPSGNIDFYIDQMRIDTDNRSTENFCEHANSGTRPGAAGL